MTVNIETQTLAIAPHLRLRGGESKLAATDAAARRIIDEAADEVARKTARLQALRLAKEAEERGAVTESAADAVKKRATLERRIA